MSTPRRPASRGLVTRCLATREAVRAAVEPLERRSYFAGVGQGLVGEYFADQALTRLAFARTDPTVNFTWPGAPAPTVPADRFSVRWTGQVLAEFSQTYTFYAGTAGGVRVWVNGAKVVDNWTSHGQVENKGTVALTAGKYYPIKVEYREDNTGSMKLSWSSSSVAKQVVPKAQLYQEGTDPTTGGWLEANVGAGAGGVLGSSGTSYDLSFGGTVVPPPPPPPPTGGTTTLRATADAYVRDGTYASQNFGLEQTFIVKTNPNVGFARNGLLKFDLSSFATADAIGSGTLRLNTKLGSAGAAVTVNVFSSADTSWTESGVNWNNQPAAGGQLGSFPVESTTAGWDEVDVTAFLKAEKAAGRNQVTFVLRSSAAHDPNVVVVADESPSNRPELVVGSGPVVPPPPPPPPPPSGGTTATLDAVADTYVRDGAYAAQNFGLEQTVIVKNNPNVGYSRNGLFEFDLSGVSSAADITAAKLRLNAKMGSAGSPITVLVFASADTGWSETGVTWDKQPPADAPLGSFDVSSTTAAYKEVDVTDYLKTEKAAGHDLVTFVLKSAAAHDPNVVVASDESAANRPQLTVTTAAPAARVRSAGGPIGGPADQFHYLFKVVRGDGQIVTRVDPLTTGTAEAGVVVRQSLGVTDRSIALTYDAAGGVSFEARTTDGGTATHSGLSGYAGAVYLKLVRDGNSYVGYASATGADDAWQLVGTAGVDLGTFAYFGLAAGADAGTTFAAGFDSAAVRAINPLGANLNNPSDRVQDLPFVDLVKTTRGFYNTAGRTATNGATAFAATDANGWPTEDFGFAAVDNSEWNVAVAAGTYKMSFAGPAGVTVSAPAGVTLTETSFDGTTHAYDVVVGAGVLKLTLTFANTAGQVKDVRLLQPGYALSGGQTFTDNYLSLLRTTNPTTLRFMDWTKANGDQDVNWADRPKTTDATQSKAVVAGDLQPGKGVAWEYVIELANDLGKDVWINVGVHATDAYVRQLADLFRTTLRADLNVYVEHSNEVWNSSFEQYTFNRSQAVAEVAANAGSNLRYDGNTAANTVADRRHARRTKQIADVFRAAWTEAGEPDPINQRVRVVLGGQVADLTRFDNELKFLKDNFGDPKGYLYGVGVAPYFGLGSYANSTTATKDQLLAGFNSSVDNYQNGAVLSNALAKAKAYGVRLIGYEGGPDTFGANNVANKRLASIDPAMQGIINRYLTAWYAKGGDLFNYYTVGARSFNSPYGTWSITEGYGQLAGPKIKGFQQVRDAVPVSTAARGVFA